MSQLSASSTRFFAWGKDHAQFLSVMGLTAGTLFYVGGSFFGLRRDLVKERELRQSDVQKERELRQLDVQKASAQGRAEVTRSMLVYGKSVSELQHADEYKDAPWRKSASNNAE